MEGLPGASGTNPYGRGWKYRLFLPASWLYESQQQQYGDDGERISDALTIEAKQAIPILSFP
jgi:hypothetical protein